MSVSAVRNTRPSAEQLRKQHWGEYLLRNRHVKAQDNAYVGFDVSEDEPKRTCIDTDKGRFALCSKITAAERTALVSLGFTPNDFKNMRAPASGLLNWFKCCLGRAEPTPFSGRLGQGTYSRVKVAKRLSAQTDNPKKDAYSLTQPQAEDFFAVKAFGSPKLSWLDWRDGLALMEQEVALLVELKTLTPEADQQFLAVRDLEVSRTFDAKGRRCLYAVMPLALCNLESISSQFAKSPDGTTKKPAKYLSPQEQDFLRKATFSVLRSLFNMHRLDMVHRDVKPSNMVLTTSGRCALIDLGLSRYVTTAGEQSLRVPSQRINDARPADITAFTGSRRYMAPELASKEAYVTLSHPKALDIWSLGTSLYEMAYGERAVEQFRKAPLKEIPKAQSCGDALAETVTDLKSFIEACLQHDPKDRPSVEALLNSPWLRGLSAESIDWSAFKEEILSYHRAVEAVTH